MKRVICNTCRNEAPMDSYGLPPSGWWHGLRKAGSYGIEAPEYCSTACLLAGVQLEVEREKAPDLAAVEG